MLDNYFHPTNHSKMVSLENSALRKKCGNELSNIALSSTVSTLPEKSMSQLKKVNSIHSFIVFKMVIYVSLNPEFYINFC